jgi:hypothetical protein
MVRLNENYAAVYGSAEWMMVPTYHLMRGEHTLCGMPVDGGGGWYGRAKYIRLPWMQKVGHLCEKCRAASAWWRPL